ncbi:MAG TPA: hypothetical protein VNZ53_39570 [Steroidobacteraceae bacterium]|jgi:hypothetical protein|nr:hypothetical protein [Steroidobacteraceae bacterium]
MRVLAIIALALLLACCNGVIIHAKHSHKADGHSTPTTRNGSPPVAGVLEAYLSGVVSADNANQPSGSG